MLTFRRILVPVDFSPCSKAALQYAAQLAESLDAAIEMLHVWEPPMYVGLGPGEVFRQVTTNEGLPLSEVVRARAGKDLDQLIAETRSRSSASVSGRIEAGNIGDTIVEIAGTSQVDLIVMGTHGRRGFSRLLMGSIADKVIRHAPCPVITYRLQEDEEEKHASAAL